MVWRRRRRTIEALQGRIAEEEGLMRKGGPGEDGWMMQRSLLVVSVSSKVLTVGGTMWILMDHAAVPSFAAGAWDAVSGIRTSRWLCGFYR